MSIAGVSCLLTTLEATWYMFSVVSVWLSVSADVCMSVCQTIIFESLDVGSLFSHTRYIWREQWSSSYIKITESRSRSQEKIGRKSLFPQCKTSIGNNSGSIKHIAVKFACSMGFSLRRIEWCNRHVNCHVTGNDHA